MNFTEGAGFLHSLLMKKAKAMSCALMKCLEMMDNSLQKANTELRREVLTTICYFNICHQLSTRASRTRKNMRDAQLDSM